MDRYYSRKPLGTHIRTENEAEGGVMHMRQMLREVSRQRTVGFGDAVDDLGTHVICGHEVPYSRAMVYNLLKGKSRSERLLKRIIEFRPDLLELSWTEKGVIERARQLGWTPRPKRARAKKEATAA